MAVSSAHTFDYEVELRARSGGGFEGTAESVQARNGELPGMAGRAPWVRTTADTVWIEARDLPSTAARALDALASIMPLLWNWVVDRRLVRASVERIELVVPELGAILESGQVLSVTQETEAGVPVHPPQARVALRAGGSLLRKWEALPVKVIDA